MRLLSMEESLRRSSWRPLHADSADSAGAGAASDSDTCPHTPTPHTLTISLQPMIFAKMIKGPQPSACHSTPWCSGHNHLPLDLQWCMHAAEHQQLLWRAPRHSDTPLYLSHNTASPSCATSVKHELTRREQGVGDMQQYFQGLRSSCTELRL